MMKGSKSSKSSASKTVATVGYISTVPGKTTVTFKGGKGGGEGSYMNKSRVSFGGKQTGCYGRAITKEKASAGEFQWKRSPTMTKGSKSSKSSASKTVATVGYISTVPGKTTVTFKGGKGGGEGSYMNKSRVSFGDKQTGCYGRATTKEKASAGEFQWKNGTSGTKSEYKKSSTLRIGDQSGYMEVYSEQRVRNVSYNKSSGSKNFIAYDNGDGGEYGWYDCY